MNKEEILKKAREENQGVDEVLRATERDAAKMSRVVGACACAFFTLMDKLVFRTGAISDICWIIYGIMITTDMWVYTANLKQKRYLTLALLGTLGCAILIAVLFLEHMYA